MPRGLRKAILQSDRHRKCPVCGRRQILEAESGKCYRCLSGKIPTPKKKPQGAGESKAVVKVIAPAVLSSRNAENMQMFSDFFEEYLPPSSSFCRKASYLRAIVEGRSGPSSALLESAMRTLCLSHLASRKQDERLHEASVFSYAQSLGFLRQALYVSSKRPDDDHTRQLITTIALLSHLDDPAARDASPTDSWAGHIWGSKQFLAARGPSEDGWASHIWGGQQLLEDRGISCLGNDDVLDHGLLRHMFHNGFMLAICKRKAWNVSVEWLKAQSLGWTNMIAAMHQLPGILERADDLLFRAEAMEDESLFKEIVDIVRECDCIRDSADGLWPSLTDPPLMKPSSIDSSAIDIEEESIMKASDVFPEVFVPVSDYEAIILTYRAMLMLVLECTILRLWALAPAHIGQTAITDSSHWAAVESRAYELACRLCKCALSFTSRPNFVHAFSLRLHLSLARNVFAAKGAMREMRWCDGCLFANMMRLKRMREEGCPPTLCRVEDLIPGIAEAGKYKSRLDQTAFEIRTKGCPWMKLLPAR